MLSRTSRWATRTPALAITLAALCACSGRKSAGKCEANADCGAGSVCISGECVLLCRTTTDCAATCPACVCRDGTCVAGGGSSGAPVIEALDAEGTPESDPTKLRHRTNGTLVVLGSNLSGAAVTLAGNTRSWPVEVCDDRDERLTLLLPTDLAPGQYALMVANQSGSCTANFATLQGEQGEQGPIGATGPAGPLPIIATGGGLEGDGSAGDPLALDPAAAAAAILGDRGCQAGQSLTGFDSSGAPVCDVASTSLANRIRSVARRGLGSAFYYEWDTVPGMVFPFVAAGGPVLVSMSIPMTGGSTSSCRPLVDGVPGGAYTGTDTTNYWQEGLSFTNDNWIMWNSSRMYDGLLVGNHTLAVQCREDSTTAVTQLGNGQMVMTASVIPFGPTASDPVKAYVATTQGGQTVAAGGYVGINGLALTFTAVGGPVRIGLSIPMNGAVGSHSSCRPLVDGLSAGSADIDDTASAWQEGLTYTDASAAGNGGWTMWNRTRLYQFIGAGSHNLTVQCYTDAGSVLLGGTSMSLQAIVVAYPDPAAAGTRARAYRAVRRGLDSIGVGAGWVTLSGLSTTFAAGGGPVEIGVSLPLYLGSHSACRPLVDDVAITTGEPDDFGYAWHEGLNYSGDGWAQWDRIRVYRNIAAGTHTLKAQCRTDGGTLQAGHANMVSTIWAVSYE